MRKTEGTMRALLGASIVVSVFGSSGCKFPDLPPIDVDASADGMMDAMPPDVQVSCTPNTTTCTAGTLVECDANGIGTPVTCGFGCASSNDRCLDLSPANGLATYLDQAATAQPLTLTGNASIDTTTGTVTDGNGSTVSVTSTMLATTPVAIMVISARSLDVGNVAVRGSRGLAILVDGDATFNGVFSANAQAFTPGPGSALNADCVAGNGYANTTGGSGSGGGGFGTQGGTGGSGGGGTIGGAGGSPHGDATLIPLRAGCPGGVPNGMPSDTYRREGAGGGAVQISIRGRITIQPGAFIAANGGGAKSYTDAPLYLCSTGGPQTCHQGAGGGAGGGILIEASSVVIAQTGGIVANGGAGHCGSHGQAPDGALSEVPAAGSSCTTYTAVGNGGAGAGGVMMAANGGSSTGQNGQGGGGGGGAGRIRINIPTGASFDPQPPVISPPPSVGTTLTR